MTIALLTLILLSYMKLTGKSLPKLEKRLNTVKNAKRNNITEVTSFAEKEIKNFDIKTSNTSFKKRPLTNIYPKIYTGNIKI